MKTQFLGLGLLVAMAFTSCQSDITSEDTQEIIETQNDLKEEKHDINKIHVCCPLEGGLEQDGGFKLHEPGYFQGALADCDTYLHYNGGKNLTVIKGNPRSYHGEIEVNNINLNDQLNICGTLEVHDDIKINYAGVFNVGGQMIAEGDLHITYGGHLVVEGNVLIEGDLVMTSGATLEFLGSDSSIEVQGETKIHKNATISGEYENRS